MKKSKKQGKHSRPNPFYALPPIVLGRFRGVSFPTALHTKRETMTRESRGFFPLQVVRYQLCQFIVMVALPISHSYEQLETTRKRNHEVALCPLPLSTAKSKLNLTTSKSTYRYPPVKG